MKPSYYYIIAAATLALYCASAQEANLTSLFDGKTLKGWEIISKGHEKFWSVENGIITCSNGDKKMPINSFLATEKEYENFEFTCEFRLSGNPATGLINSGIQYRTQLHETRQKGDLKLSGYQADIGDGWWGGLYDEHRRGLLSKGNTTELLKDFQSDAWHTYKIICHGDNHKLYIDGHITLDYTEKDAAIPKRGYFALQLHSGGIAKIEYKDIQIKELPAG